MIRAVLDTNVIVSPLLHPLAPPARVFLPAINGAIQLCVSGNVYAEYEEAIRRPRFRVTETRISSTLDTIREKSVWVRPTEVIRACSDPDGDIFLECASAGEADYLVTGKSQTLPVIVDENADCDPATLAGHAVLVVIARPYCTILVSGSS